LIGLGGASLNLPLLLGDSAGENYRGEINGSHATIGVVGRIQLREFRESGYGQTSGTSRHVYSGLSSWEEWIMHFENVSAVNEWTGDQKLQWLKVRLTSRAQTAFQRLAGETQQSYERAKAALQERFEPKSWQSRYQAEFQTRRKKRSETWADFADDLKLLVDRGFLELEDPAQVPSSAHVPTAVRRATSGVQCQTETPEDAQGSSHRYTRNGVVPISDQTTDGLD